MNLQFEPSQPASPLLTLAASLPFRQRRDAGQVTPGQLAARCGPGGASVAVCDPRTSYARAGLRRLYDAANPPALAARSPSTTPTATTSVTPRVCRVLLNRQSCESRAHAPPPPSPLAPRSSQAPPWIGFAIRAGPVFLLQVLCTQEAISPRSWHWIRSCARAFFINFWRVWTAPMSPLLNGVFWVDACQVPGLRGLSPWPKSAHPGKPRRMAEVHPPRPRG